MLKQAHVFVFLLMAILLAACGGTPTNPNSNDKTPPLLNSSLPPNAASTVPINSKLGFNFNEAMDESSLELTTTPPILLGNPTWNAQSTGVAFDNARLAVSTPYTLTLKAKDVSGNALAETIVAFTTSDTTDITAPTTPTDLVATPANGQVALTWQANPESDVVGYTLYVGTRQDALEPKDFVTTNSKTFTNLTNGTTYFFAVDAVDAANNPSGQTAPVSATPSATVTDTTPPTIQSSTPANNATDVSGEFVFTLTFSEPMDKGNLIATLDPPQYGLELVTWSNNDTVLTLSPSQLHLFEETENTVYTLTLNAKDKAGNALSGKKEISFKTGFKVPKLVSSIPADGATNVAASILKSSVITLTFSEGVRPDTFQIDDGDFPYGCSILKSEIPNLVQSEFTLMCELNDSTTYSLAYKGEDLDFHAFEGIISFSTVPDTVPPSVFFTNPNDLEINVPLAQEIEIGFNDEMDQASTLAAVSSLPDLGCTWTLSETKDFLLCNPTNLQGNTTYTITVAETAQDTSGKNLVGAGACRGTPPCSYEFMFSTIITATTGSLRVNTSGLPSGQNRVRVTGPNGYTSGFFDSSTTFTDLTPGDYVVTATSFVVAPGKPACRIYTPTPASQTETVIAGGTATASVSYSFESCALPDEP